MKKLTIALLIGAVTLGLGFLFEVSVKSATAETSPAPTPPPTIYVGEYKQVGVGGSSVVVITVDGKRFICYSAGGICPIN